MLLYRQYKEDTTGGGAYINDYPYDSNFHLKLGPGPESAVPGRGVLLQWKSDRYFVERLQNLAQNPITGRKEWLRVSYLNHIDELQVLQIL